jgi:hypothetical protein
MGDYISVSDNEFGIAGGDGYRRLTVGYLTDFVEARPAEKLEGAHLDSY